MDRLCGAGLAVWSCAREGASKGRSVKERTLRYGSVRSNFDATVAKQHRKPGFSNQESRFAAPTLV